MEDFEQYQKYVDMEDYQYALKILEAEKIPFKIVDKSFSMNDLNPGLRRLEVDLYLKKEDFTKADILLIDSIDNQHYLFDFSDEELIEVLVKEEEWSEFDINLTVQILKERGKKIDGDFLNHIKKLRKEVQSEPDEHQKGWIIAGYGFVIGGGVFSLIIGYYLAMSKKRLDSGEKVYKFSEADRKHGQYIIILGLIFSTIYIILRFS